MQNRPFDVIIWGATGFTGQLVVEFLRDQYGVEGDLHWAIAGRNEAKLESIRQKLALPDLPIIIADSHDKSSLVHLVKQTRVVCSTVGPYALYGTLLVEACVENGTDYCDLTGEVQWMRKVIDNYHSKAKSNQVKIVHCCGFDAIPSDLGVFFLQSIAKKRTGQYCQHIKMRLKGASGGFSGGTFMSLLNVLIEVGKDPSIYDIVWQPYSLNPPEHRSGPDQRDILKATFDQDLGKWTSPFIMAMINTKIVRRSHALNGFPYGKDFQYDEATLHGSNLKSRIVANIFAFFVRLISRLRPIAFFQKLTRRFFPKPGEGPSKAVRDAGFFYLLFFGKLPNGQHLTAKVKGDKDPGYGSTSKMLAESAVCLALDKEKTPELYGVLTPSTAMGDSLLQRLMDNAGVSFELEGSEA